MKNQMRREKRSPNEDAWHTIKVGVLLGIPLIVSLVIIV